MNEEKMTQQLQQMQEDSKLGPAAIDPLAWTRVLRLRAILACLADDRGPYDAHGGQKRFAKQIGVEYANFNVVWNGSSPNGVPLTVALPLVRRFPVVSLD